MLFRRTVFINLKFGGGVLWNKHIAGVVDMEQMGTMHLFNLLFSRFRPHFFYLDDFHLRALL